MPLENEEVVPPGWKRVEKCYGCEAVERTRVAKRADLLFLAACSQCDSVYLEMIPQDLSIFYGPDYFGNSTEIGTTGGYKDYSDQYQPITYHWAFRLIDYMRERGPNVPKHILDIGCSIGSLLTLFKEAQYKTSGLEMVSTAAETARSFGHNVLQAEFAQIKFSNSFGVVTAFEVLEHLADFESFFSVVKSQLAKDGLFVAYLPLGKSERFHNSAGNYKWLSNSLQHTVYFSKKGLELLLEKHFPGQFYVFTHDYLEVGQQFTDAIIFARQGPLTINDRALFKAISEMSPTKNQDPIVDKIVGLLNAKFGRFEIAEMCFHPFVDDSIETILDELAYRFHQGGIDRAVKLISKLPAETKSRYSIRKAEQTVQKIYDEIHENDPKEGKPRSTFRAVLDKAKALLQYRR